METKRKNNPIKPVIYINLFANVFDNCLLYRFKNRDGKNRNIKSRTLTTKKIELPGM
jgi:hypothetical protein